MTLMNLSFIITNIIERPHGLRSSAKTLKSLLTSCFKYSTIIKFSKFCKNGKCFAIFDLPASSKVTKNIFNLQEWHQNTRNCKSLFHQICIVDKIFTVRVKTKNLSRTTRFGLWLFYKDVL